jgi:hypothetical protein
MTEPEASVPPPPRAPTFFHRFAQHLRRQDWVAVVIELLIVVLGVFLGLQVNEWAADRADERRSEMYAERLVADLQTDLQRRQELVAYYDAVFDSAERTYAMLSDPGSDDRALVINAYRATEYNYSPPTSATWDEIVSSGDLSLLPTPALEGASAYFRDDTARTVAEPLRQSLYRQTVRSLLPHEVQRAIRESCSDVLDSQNQITGFRQDCDLDVAVAEIDAAAGALRSDPQILSNLRYHFSTVANARINLRADVIFIEGALAALRDRSPDP